MPIDPFNPQLAIQGDLVSGERVLWSGQPDPNSLLTAADVSLIPFSLLWGGLAVFWELRALSSIPPAGTVDPLSVLWGIPFLVLGQYFIWGRFIYKRWKRKHTVYALTNRRVLVLSDAPRRRLESAFVEQLTGINKSSRADGRGTLEFGSPAPKRWWSSGQSYANTGMEFLSRGGLGYPVFYDITDADRVYQLAMGLRQPA